MFLPTMRVGWQSAAGVDPPPPDPVPAIAPGPLTFATSATPSETFSVNTGGEWQHSSGTELMCLLAFRYGSSTAADPGLTWNGTPMTRFLLGEPAAGVASGRIGIAGYRLSGATVGGQTLAVASTGGTTGRYRGLLFDVSDFGSIAWSDHFSQAADPAALEVTAPARSAADTKLLVSIGVLHRREGSGNLPTVSSGWTLQGAITAGSNNTDLIQSRAGWASRLGTGASVAAMFSVTGINATTWIAGATLEIAAP